MNPQVPVYRQRGREQARLHCWIDSGLKEELDKEAQARHISVARLVEAALIARQGDAPVKVKTYYTLANEPVVVTTYKDGMVFERFPNGHGVAHLSTGQTYVKTPGDGLTYAIWEQALRASFAPISDPPVTIGEPNEQDPA